MRTDCQQTTCEFHPLENRSVEAEFDEGTITSDGERYYRGSWKRSGGSSNLPRLSG